MVPHRNMGSAQLNVGMLTFHLREFTSFLVLPTA